MAKKQKVLSIIIPAYNEAATIKEAVKQVKRTRIPGIKKEIIIINDGSTDGTSGILKKMGAKEIDLKIIHLDKNMGKGAALRRGIEKATGDFTIIQDADLEYDPEDFNDMLAPILKGRADVVYGSRFLGTHRSFLFWNYFANKLLTLFTNILFNTILTDMETCYKLFKTQLLQGLSLKSKGFDIEPEITAKVLKKKYKIYEVPIHFYGRSYDEGKKIKASDGIKAFFTILWYRFF